MRSSVKFTIDTIPSCPQLRHASTRLPIAQAPTFRRDSGSNLTEEEEITIRCAFACASQLKNEQLASSKGATADLAGGFRLANNDGWWNEAFVHGSIRRY